MFWVIVLLAFTILGAFFAWQNSSLVDVNLIFIPPQQVPLALVMLGSAAFGALFIILLWMVKQIKVSMKLWEYQGKIRQLEAQVKKTQAEKEKLESELQVLREKKDQLENELNQRLSAPDTPNTGGSAG